MAANKGEQWQLLATHLRRTDLLETAEFATREDRKRNRLHLKAELETVLTTRPARAWAKELNRLGVPAGAVLTVPEVLDHPQITGRDFLARFNDTPGVGRPIDLLRIGVMMDGKRPAVSAPPPALGADTDDMLAKLGYSTDEIGTLRKEGVV